jgi:hypothetical protein
MPTTLTLDDDVGAALDALRRTRGLSMKDAVNTALRGVSENDQPRPAFVTKNADLGPARLPLDNIADALAAAEDEGFR